MISRSLAHFLRGKKKTRGIDSISLLRSGVPFEFRISWDRPWFTINRRGKTPQASFFIFLIPVHSLSPLSFFIIIIFFLFFYNTATTTTFGPITLAVSMRDPVSISSERISRRHLRKAIRVHSNPLNGDAEFSIVRVISFERWSQSVLELRFITIVLDFCFSFFTPLRFRFCYLCLYFRANRFLNLQLVVNLLNKIGESILKY